MGTGIDITDEPLVDNSFRIHRLDGQSVLADGPVRLRYHRIVLVEQGEGSVAIDDRTFEIHGGEAFLLSKGTSPPFQKPNGRCGACAFVRRLFLGTHACKRKQLQISLVQQYHGQPSAVAQ